MNIKEMSRCLCKEFIGEYKFLVILFILNVGRYYILLRLARAFFLLTDLIFEIFFSSYANQIALNNNKDEDLKRKPELVLYSYGRRMYKATTPVNEVFIKCFKNPLEQITT